ncbi:unnamed protein product [Angiostrongylus costaricensis]|uniref:Reverse transcriptase domain-containing protein n=1 Tax=Angiostrongylus costaricensis TaxID=334426 RepID=A0A158PDS0_ANGCS|nr:unnamed protein product [Angiostrongylus costaricensis]
MSDCGCEVQIDVPAWVPGAIAFAISVAVAIAVCITYILREMERHKNFYGREDKLSAREQPAEAIKKEEMDTYALGRCSDEVLVIKSPPQRSGGPPSGNVGTGVKVMLRKKRIIMKTPNRAPTTSIPTSVEQVSPNYVNITVTYDKTGRGFENKNEHLQLVDVIGRESPILGSRTKRAETLTMLIKNRLEKMIGHNFIIYGSLEEMKWTVKGLENLKDNVEEMHLQMRLSVDAWNLRIMAFKLTEQGIREKELFLYAGKALRSGKMRPSATSDTGQALSSAGKPAANNNDDVRCYD